MNQVANCIMCGTPVTQKRINDVNKRRKVADRILSVDTCSQSCHNTSLMARGARFSKGAGR
jgi:uncharacterized metal-binding protein